MKYYLFPDLCKKYLTIPIRFEDKNKIRQKNESEKPQKSDTKLAEVQKKNPQKKKKSKRF